MLYQWFQAHYRRILLILNGLRILHRAALYNIRITFDEKGRKASLPTQSH